MLFYITEWLKIFIFLYALLLTDLVLDAMDSSGEQHLQMDHNIHKRRLDLNGVPIEEPKKQEIAISSTVSPYLFLGPLSCLLLFLFGTKFPFQFKTKIIIRPIWLTCKQNRLSEHNKIFLHITVILMIVILFLLLKMKNITLE